MKELITSNLLIQDLRSDFLKGNGISAIVDRNMYT